MNLAGLEKKLSIKLDNKLLNAKIASLGLMLDATLNKKQKALKDESKLLFKDWLKTKKGTEEEKTSWQNLIDKKNEIYSTLGLIQRTMFNKLMTHLKSYGLDIN